MLRVNPFRVLRDDHTGRAKLLLRLQGSNKCFFITLSMEQARYISSEMNGLATDHCSHHRILDALADAFHAILVSVNLREVGNGCVAGAIRVESGARTIEVDVDVAVGLSIAIHQGIPVYLSGAHLLPKDGLNAAQPPAEPLDPPQIPAAFREVIEGLDAL